MNDSIQFQSTLNHKTKRLKSKSMVMHDLNSLHFLATMRCDTQCNKLEYKKTNLFSEISGLKWLNRELTKLDGSSYEMLRK